MTDLRTIPSGVPFAEALADGILMECGSDPLVLSRVQVLLPTRRACRSLREAFLKQSGGDPLLLPRMRPLGDVDAEELLLGGPEEGLSADIAFDLPPAIDPLRRQLLLAQLIMTPAFGAHGAEQALQLAAELARLLDQIETEERDIQDLKALVREDGLSEHWQVVLTFLDILISHWPGILEQEGCLDAAQRRALLMDAQAKAWRTEPPQTRIIAAGSTGTIPATARLLQVVANMPNGTVVLPGLDRRLDSASWTALEPTHPQYGMKRMLATFGVEREAVKDWCIEANPKRQLLLSHALLPAETTNRWSRVHRDTTELSGVRLIEAETQSQEALAIALAMRESLERPDLRLCALVTPDRTLARRVKAQLTRWGLKIDDSAGEPLAESRAGAFLRLTARMIADDFSPLTFLAALKHPLAAGGETPGTFRARVRMLERAILHGPAPTGGLNGFHTALGELAARIDADDAPGVQVSVADCRELQNWVAGLNRRLDAFTVLRDAGPKPLVAWAEAHVALAETLAESNDRSGPARLWDGEDGDAASQLLRAIPDAAKDFPAVQLEEYPDVLELLMAGRPIRPRYRTTSRLVIWGTLEARLQSADRVILGGLNEGVWPPDAKAGPWMSRPMQRDFGLPLPERRIGLSAHDFVQAFAAPEVLLTRAKRVDGSPTLPSRWLVRLKALTGGLPMAENYLSWAMALDAAATYAPWPAPEPRPPVDARPDRLSVTRIETWVRDPYAVYAEKVLGLSALAPIDAEAGAADRGNIIHDALDAFCKAYPKDLPPDARERLLDMGREAFAPYLVYAGVQAYWWPRFERIADWFLDWERERRAKGIFPIATEVKGRWNPPTGGIPFTVTAKADRIDRTGTGDYVIADYKTGTPPTFKQAATGLSPQLVLEAAMMQGRAFKGLAAGAVEDLAYIKLSGGREPGKETTYTQWLSNSRDKSDSKKPLPELTAELTQKLGRMIQRYADPNMPYLSRPRPQFVKYDGDFDHLARVKEWSAGVGEGGNEGGDA